MIKKNYHKQNNVQYTHILPNIYMLKKFHYYLHITDEETEA